VERWGLKNNRTFKKVNQSLFIFCTAREGDSERGGERGSTRKCEDTYVFNMSGGYSQGIIITYMPALDDHRSNRWIAVQGNR
jgi:hypothetical protein